MKGGEIMALDYKMIGMRIQRIRKEHRLSQSELAELIDRSVPYISHIETGRKRVSLEVLSSIAEALDVSVNVLTGENPEQQRQAYVFELDALLADLTVDEQKMILDLVYAAKDILVKYRRLRNHDGNSF